MKTFYSFIYIFALCGVFIAFGYYLSPQFSANLKMHRAHIQTQPYNPHSFGVAYEDTDLLRAASIKPVTISVAEASAVSKKIKTIDSTDFENVPYKSVRVYFATDRNLIETDKNIVSFGGNRSETISYGACNVTIPKLHTIGEIERPEELFFLGFKEDPKKHIVLLKTDVHHRDDFFSEVKQRIAASEEKKTFIFVHGYNTSFADAARRTAQMAYDLGFDDRGGAPVFYSWPSEKKLANYTVDEANNEWTKSHLRNFLEEFVARTEADNIYLIAHSMGSRALTNAVIDLLHDEPSLRERIAGIILAAPDIDAGVFKRDIAPAIGSRLTLYASSKDKALAASKKIHGSPRAGDTSGNLVILPGVETIDASEIDTSFIGHSYFGDSRPLLSDMYYLIQRKLSADKRFDLTAVDSSLGRYWVFKK